MSTYKAPITMEDLALMSGGRPVHHKKPIKTARADVKKVKAQANKFAKYLDKKQTSKPEITAKPKPKSAATGTKPKPKSAATGTKPKPKSSTGTKPKTKSTATKPKPKPATGTKAKSATKSSSTATKPKSAPKSVKKTGTSAHPNFKPANNTRPLMKW